MYLLELHSPQLLEGRNDPHIFKAIFMAGAPGSGKDLIIQHMGLNATGLKMLDLDRALAYLKTAKPHKADYDTSHNIIKKREEAYEQNMLGMTINSTGRNYDAIMHLNKKLKEVGYDTFMVFIDVEHGIATDRFREREKTAEHPKDRDRVVDDEYFQRAYAEIYQNVDFYALMFGKNFAIVSNNKQYDPRNIDKSLARATKQVDHFLRKPLSLKAQARIKQATATPR